MSLSTIEKNLQEIRFRIDAACSLAGRRTSEVTILPVTKKQPLEKLEALYELGERSFGENRVQEMNEKAAVLPKDIKWHLIGPLQSNKVRAALKSACSIHSIDSLKLLDRVNRIAAEENKCPEIFLQVNITGESQKSGFTESELPEAVGKASCYENLRLRGLMTMGAAGADSEETRAVFRRLRELRDSFLADFPKLTELSMGMSGDFELAILEGATYIRVGSLLLGERQY